MESGTSLQPMSENTLPSPLSQALPSPPHHHHHHRRHIRYATPENSTPPQFILETASSNQRSVSNNRQSLRPPSPSPPPSAVNLPADARRVHGSMPSPSTRGGESNAVTQAFESVPPAPVDGQDHDRMETDEENDGSDGSGSEPEADTSDPEAPTAETQPFGVSLEEDEIMDTSPDNPPVDELPPPEPPPHANPEGTTNEASTQSESPHPVLGDEPPENSSTVAELAETMDAAVERVLTGTSETGGEERPSERRPAQGSRREGTGEDAEADEESDDSSDDEEHPYWVNLKEDTSTPDERELQMIEEAGNEVSALDHDHWEKLVYEPLDDPEYVPGESGRLTWTVKGVHGTAEKPNREKIMRSPSVQIGGYNWNIKYFPHGNDGTEQLSIYLECSPVPHDEPVIETESTAAPKSPGEVDGPLAAVATLDQSSAMEGATDQPTAPSGEAAVTPSSAEPEIVVDTSTPPKKDEAKLQNSWGTAAQISCILYNPEEPRVNVYQKGCHRYYSESPDWGWTRFHGPWDEIHKRQRYQRQALLRNDTLAFTAYIRVIIDDTKALWWHPPKDDPEWHSEAMTGVRAIECQAYQSSGMVAALSTWMHLKSFQQLVSKIDIPDPVWEANKRMKPAFEELQDLYDEAGSAIPEERNMSLRGLVSILNFYSANVDSKMDVVRIWETLRRVLNYEASGLDSVEEGNDPGRDLFKDILLLKQPDPLNYADPATKYPMKAHGGTFFSPDLEPHSVQETLDKATCSENTAMRMWQSFEGQRQAPPFQPAVLQIELHRQGYNKEARKWRKLTHQIKMHETLMFNESEYTLYGMIVHSGDLESNDYYSVIRPEGPGTRWIKYADHARKVTILTSQQAIKIHEGYGDNTEGVAPVAYIVLYVRSDELPGILCTPFNHYKREETKALSTEASTPPPEEEMMDSNDEPEMPVFVYGADGFEGYGGRGICDPWKSQKEGKFVKEISLPSSTTIGKVKEHVNSGIFNVVNPETQEIRVWPMNTFITDVAPRAFPSLLPFKTYCEETIDEMGQHSGGCRFWMAVTDKVVVPPQETPAPESSSEPDRAHEREMREYEIQAVMNSIQAAEEIANGDGPPDIEMTGDGVLPQDPERRRQRRQQQQQLLLHMQQAQQQQQEQLAAQEARRRQRELERDIQQAKRTYFLVKVFDAQKQSLRGFGSDIVKSESKIVEETKKLLKVDPSEPWDCYTERGIEIESRDLVKSHETFEMKCGDADGIIIIAQRRLSATDITAIENEGKCTSPKEYFSYLEGHDNPTYLRPYLLHSYFGSSYTSGTLVDGALHGTGTLITLDGDSYTGTFTAGIKSGHGTMDYSNGDTYIGEWKANEPNGTGKMVYAKTGNVYTGGFMKRKRHGKGTMEFQIADEELLLCKICYEVEMNALFYDCGHVAACEECARQVDQCPVCRKRVVAVVRIWRS